MIIIYDNDLPITAAKKIITGVKSHHPNPVQKAFSVMLSGDETAGDTIDMYSSEEIKEIADYLLVYYNSHLNGD